MGAVGPAIGVADGTPGLVTQPIAVEPVATLTVTSDPTPEEHPQQPAATAEVLTAALRLESMPRLESLFVGYIKPKFKAEDVVTVIQSGTHISRDHIQVMAANIRPAHGNAFKISVPRDKITVTTGILKSCDSNLIVEPWREPRNNHNFRNNQSQQQRRPFNNRRNNGQQFDRGYQQRDDTYQRRDDLFHDEYDQFQNRNNNRNNNYRNNNYRNNNNNRNYNNSPRRWQ